MNNEPSGMWGGAQPYERYIGRWSAKAATEFLATLPVGPACRWLDVGCGTGALTEAILAAREPIGVDGVDPSEVFLSYARERVADERAQFHVGEATDLPFATGAFDVVVSGLVLNFVDDPPRALREMTRVARANGVIGAYVWDYADGMRAIRHFWDAAVELDPSALELDEGKRFPLARADPLERLFADAGLASVVVRPIEIPTAFVDFEDLWSPFLGGQGPAGEYVAALDVEHRSALREHIRESVPARPDGSIHLTARAWTVHGRTD